MTDEDLHRLFAALRRADSAQCPPPPDLVGLVEREAPPDRRWSWLGAGLLAAALLLALLFAERRPVPSDDLAVVRALCAELAGRAAADSSLTLDRPVASDRWRLTP